ncbi:hypothetical protein DACRYDRAFT_116735 [Dacryopinax primogenitus]|uniref:Uncharacterized protein n=1 Tax=Dacryopinax primogenitus (strain DJM 731) TaxID=1858805 RepID=M5G0J5_DACPD|nr:uncharacterized protein DACRYDRAFT_116735 [Dacryopinax primogenitus]EJU01650.1 hypothetical protein DACRYDRAFT_116735 [Dacryopinax primogenitus]
MVRISVFLEREKNRPSHPPSRGARAFASAFPSPESFDLTSMVKPPSRMRTAPVHAFSNLRFSLGYSPKNSPIIRLLHGGTTRRSISGQIPLDRSPMFLDDQPTPDTLAGLLSGPFPPLDPGSSGISTPSPNTRKPSITELATAYPLTSIEKWTPLNKLPAMAKTILDFVDSNRLPHPSLEKLLPIDSIWARRVHFPMVGSREAATEAYVDRYFLEPSSHILALLTRCAYGTEPEFTIKGGSCDRVVISRPSL